MASQNGANVDSLSSKAFVSKVFFEADSGRSGQISRAQLREFIGQNPVETAHLAKESSSAHSEPVTLSLLQILEHSEAGLFDKKQVTAKVKQLAVQNGIALNAVALQSLMSKVFAKADFRNSGAINRLALHIAMDSFASELNQLFQGKQLEFDQDPALDKIFDVLEATDIGLLSKGDVRQALRTVLGAEGKELDNAQASALLE